MTRIGLSLNGFAAVTVQCADIKQWQIWARSRESAAPTGNEADFSCIPAGVRRRLGALGRCALAAYAALEPSASEPTVWASNWGDIAKTFKLTSTLAESNETSPAEFALSVHNAIGAQAAIWRKNHLPCTALAAGSITASAALIEAFVQLREAPSVIVVRYEEGLPELWRPQDAQELPAVAWAARLCLQGKGTPLTLESFKPSQPALCGGILEEIRFLCAGASTYVETDGRRGWRWGRT